MMMTRRYFSALCIDLPSGGQVKLNLVTFVIWILLACNVFAAEYDAVHYEIGSNQKKILFTSKRSEKIDGHRKIIQVVFSDPQGHVAVTEEGVVENGNIVSYTVDQKQTNEWGSLEVKGNKVSFTYKKEGKTSADDEDLKENLVVAPTLVDYLKKNWSTILKGDDVDVRYAALDRKETVGFKFFKVKEERRDGVDTVTVKMKPTSFVIAAIVSPLFFTFEKSDAKLIEIAGRTLPKLKSGDKYKDLDADSFYHYTTTD
jgi:hypothetical protein